MSSGVEDLEIHTGSQGCGFRVLARPSGRRNRCVGIHGGALKVEVTDPPDKGRANAGIVKLLSRLLSVPRSDIEIVRGAHGREKTLRFFRLDPGTLKDRVAVMLESTDGGRSS